MQKRNEQLLICNIAVGQIFLIVTSIFAFAFLVSGMGLVSGQGSSGPSVDDFEKWLKDEDDYINTLWQSEKNIIERRDGRPPNIGDVDNFLEQQNTRDEAGVVIYDNWNDYKEGGGSTPPSEDKGIVGGLLATISGVINNVIGSTPPQSGGGGDAGDSSTKFSHLPIPDEPLGTEDAKYLQQLEMRGAADKFDPELKEDLSTTVTPVAALGVVNQYLGRGEGVGEIEGPFPDEGGVEDVGGGSQDDYVPPDVGPDGLTDFVRRPGAAGAAAASFWSKEGLKTFWGHLKMGFEAAFYVAAAIQLVGRAAGFDSEQVNSATLAAVAGTLAGKIWHGYTGRLTQSVGFGLGVALLVLAVTYEEKSEKIVTFQCHAWQPKIGGQRCEECNDDEFRPCSEYRCKSLGQACELINKGSTEEKCVWINPNDVISPTITPWDEALSDRHIYTSHSTLPPSLGTRVTFMDNREGCVRPFTPLEFGVELNEPGQCKIDFVHTDTFDDMRFFFGENNFFRDKHQQRLSLPSPDSVSAESPEIVNDGKNDFYVRCQDANGNVNAQEFVFSVCVDPSPDTTPPIIVDTSLAPGSPVAFGIGETEFSVFVNEPAECRWSLDDRDYESMENVMDCSKSILEQNAQQLYPCSTTLTGIKDRENNEFYFRCKDQPKKPENERNVNKQSLLITLRGTQELNILSYSPLDGSVAFGSTEEVGVDLLIETSNGADEGKAICYFSDSGEEGTFVAMFETDSHKHKQTLLRPAGQYEYTLRCIDAGGNTAEVKTSFRVDIDRTPPKITRAYKESDALKIVTAEDAECAYSLNNCNFGFDEGVKMSQIDPDVRQNHFAEWGANRVYYIKCEDAFGNQPSSNVCTLIVSASDVV
jgi:hypothetical protein